MASYPSLTASGPVQRSEFALAEEAVPDLGIAKSRLAAQAELVSELTARRHAVQ